jgi:pSer/pThr/pTyr-binding forkhead associated (FHA) protein
MRAAYLVAAGATAGTYELSGQAVTLGRAADNSIVLQDQQTSNHHARFERTSGGGVEVHDLGSTNGTFVNGDRVQGSAAVPEDAEIRIGGTTFTLKLADAVAADGAGKPTSIVAPTVVQRRIKLTDSLVVLEGDAPGTVYNLEADNVSIGRDPRNQVVLNDVRLSGFHARLQRGLDGGIILEDRGSTNGTYLNGVLLEDPQPLLDGDLIQLGQTTLQLKRTA